MALFRSASLVLAMRHAHDRRRLERFLGLVGDSIDIILFGDDLGMDNGPLMSPQTYRDIFKPRHAALNAYVHERSSMKTFLHSCGSLYALLPDIVETGVDILNPVQISVPGMDAQKLKRTWGREIVFWGGGIDAQHVLPFASPDDVRRAVCQNVETFKPGGGYVFNNVHNIQAGVPPENIVAMYETIHDLG